MILQHEIHQGIKELGGPADLFGGKVSVGALIGLMERIF
jgi:hypothetical protein